MAKIIGSYLPGLENPGSVSGISFTHVDCKKAVCLHIVLEQQENHHVASISPFQSCRKRLH